MDLTGWSIALGLVGTTPYALLKILRHRSVDVAGLVTLFLGMFSAPLAIASCRAAIIGDVNQLPTNWRELLAVAGVVTLGLTVWLVVNSYARVMRPVPDTVPGPLRLEAGARGEVKPE